MTDDKRPDCGIIVPEHTGLCLECAVHHMRESEDYA